MKDEALQTDPALSVAEQAVSYMLQRMRVDVNLRHYLIGTEAFAKLCEAEAKRIGTDAESIEAIYSQLAPHLAGHKATVVHHRDKLEKIGDALFRVRHEGLDGIAALLEIDTIVGK